MANLQNVDNVNFQDENNNNTLLHKSVLKNQLEEVKKLLKKGADASLANNDGNTPLHEAAVKNYHQIVQAILEYSNRDKLKKFIDARTLENNSTALHIAASNGCFESVSCLLSYGANFEVKNNNGSRPIDLVKDEKVKKLLVDVELDSRLATQGKYEILRTRFKNYSEAEQLASAYARNGRNMTPLQMAVLNNHSNTVRVIVDDVRANLRGYCYAIDTEEVLHKISELIEHGKKHSDHSSSLMLHSQDVHMYDNESIVYEVTEILSAAYNIVKAVEKAFTPDNGEPFVLSGILAVIEETLEALEFKPEYAGCDDNRNIVLQRNEARFYKMLCIHDDEDEDYDDFEDENKIISYMGILQLAITRNVAHFMGSFFTAKLVEAARDNNMEMFDKCIEEQFVDVNLFLEDTGRQTPLHYAAENGNEEMVIKLLKKKAQVFWYTETNCETALYVATKKGHVGIMRLLLQSCGDDCISDMPTYKEGWVPMHIAAVNGRLDAIKCLLEYEAAYDMKDNNGKKPVDLSKNAQVTGLLKSLDEFFEMAKNGNADLAEKLKAFQKGNLLAVVNARNERRRTLVQVAEDHGYHALASQISKTATPAPSKPKDIDFDEHFHEVEMWQLMVTLRRSKT